jgi:hypothetical protein
MVKKASGLDVVACLPARIGFNPVDSIMIGGLHPPRGLLGIVIRADRAALGCPEFGDIAGHHVDRLVGSGARRSFVTRFAPVGSVPIEDDAPFWAWADAVHARLPITGCWDVVGESYQEIEPTRRRPIGPSYGLEDLQATRGAATVAMAGLAPKATREDLAKIALAPDLARKAARAAERRVADQVLALTPELMRRWRLAGLENWTGWQGRLMDQPGVAVPAAALGRIAALLADRIGRDAVMASAFKHCGDVPKRLAEGRQEAAIFDPYNSQGLDHPRAEASLALLEQVASHLVPRRRGAVYALGAAWHWWLGNGPAAEEWARAGMDCRDCPQLACLTLALVTQGIFPAVLGRLGR